MQKVSQRVSRRAAGRGLIGVPMSTRTLLSAEEFLTLPGDEPRELIRGEVVDMTPPGQRHGFVCANVAYVLNEWARRVKAGVVLTNDSTVLTERDPDTVRGPDVQFIARHRLTPAFPARGSAATPPDLIVEVVLETDLGHRVIETIVEFLDAGVQEVWVVEPEGQFVEVFHLETRPRRVEGEEPLESPQLLPGFRCSVSEFFAVY